MFTTLDSGQARDYMKVTTEKDDNLVSLKVINGHIKNEDYWKNKEYTATVKKYQDENGNTYHAVRLVRFSDNDEIRFKRYGYDSQYKTTTVEEMQKADWINGYDEYNPPSKQRLMNEQQNAIHFYDVGYVKKREFGKWSQW
tara:strand:+ start:1462 stop:1884 length:423 start_codon:yes stop_codon:yes gene_type:complete